MRGDGIHLVMSNCSLEIADRPDKLKKEIDKIIKFTKLKRLGEGDAQEGTNSMEGWSVTQIIETSHIAIHGFKTNNIYMIDVVSCKPFDYHKLTQNMIRTFHPKRWHMDYFPVDTIVDVESGIKQEHTKRNK